MAYLVACTGCQRRLSFKDDPAGKRVKCPGCSTIIAVPLPAAVAIAEAPPAVAELEEEGPVGKRRKKRKKRRGVERGPVEPIFSFAGIGFTPVLLVIFGSALLCMIGGGVALFTLTPLKNWFSSAPDIKAIDVYTAVNGMRYRDVGERVLQSKTVTYCIPGHRKILVTRDNPDGKFLLMKAKISYKEVDAYAQGSRGRFYLSPGMVKLQAGDEILDPLFIQDDNDSTHGFHLDFSPAKGSNAGPLRDYLGPKPGGWSHDGDLKEAGEGLEFTGRGGMNVKIRTGDERMDGNENKNPIERATGKKIGRDVEGLVASPEGYIHVTWDRGSDGYIVTYDLEQPNEIGLSWTVNCIFPRPKNGVKEATLEVLGKPRKIKLP